MIATKPATPLMMPEIRSLAAGPAATAATGTGRREMANSGRATTMSRALAARSEGAWVWRAGAGKPSGCKTRLLVTGSAHSVAINSNNPAAAAQTSFGAVGSLLPEIDSPKNKPSAIAAGSAVTVNFVVVQHICSRSGGT